MAILCKLPCTQISCHLVVELEDMDGVVLERPHKGSRKHPFKKGHVHCGECDVDLGNIQDNMPGKFLGREVAIVKFANVHLNLEQRTNKGIQLKGAALGKASFKQDCSSSLVQVTPELVLAALPYSLESIKPCRFFVFGRCKLGDKCRFAHNVEE